MLTTTNAVDLAAIRAFGNLELLAKQQVEGFITGLHQSPFHGFSVEFAEHKIYNPGESIRHIDWKVYAKSERLYTKRYEEETNLRCQILLDCSSSMYYPEQTHGKMAFGIMAAASLAFLLQRQRDAVGMTTFTDQIETTTPIKATSTHLHKLLVGLQQHANQPATAKQTRLAPVLHDVADQLNRRGLVFILSDMFDQESEDDLFAALNHLRHNHHEVVLVHIIDKATELEFEFQNRPMEFVDLETNERLKLNPTTIKEHYSEQINAYYEQLKLKCGSFKIDYVLADIAEGVNQVLQAYLIKRSKMA